VSDFRANDPYLQVRYGIKQVRAPWIVPAIVTALVGGAWLIWSAWFHTQGSITTSVLTYQKISDQKISVNYSYEVGKKGGKYLCTFTAVDQLSNVVGEINVAMPTGPSHGNATQIIPTRSAATSVTLDSCILSR
jgi:hypothetical protein